jgi:hypothetical protein
MWGRFPRFIKCPAQNAKEVAMTDDKKAKAPTENWGDLSPEVRSAIIKQANNQIFWENALIRVGAFGKFAQVVLVIIAFLAAVRVGVVDWLMGAKE